MNTSPTFCMDMGAFILIEPIAHLIHPDRGHKLKAWNDWIDTSNKGALMASMANFIRHSFILWFLSSFIHTFTHSFNQ